MSRDTELRVRVGRGFSDREGSQTDLHVNPVPYHSPITAAHWWWLKDNPRIDRI